MGAGRWRCVLCGKRMGPYRCWARQRRVCLKCECDCPMVKAAAAVKHVHGTKGGER